MSEMFKAWDNKNKSWVKPFSLFVDSNGLIYSNKLIQCNFDSLTFLDDATLCRSTGLKDKNGKDIFEFDIVKATGFNPEKYLIEFVEGGFALTNNHIDILPIDINILYPSIGCQIEIIGNIFEHPNLLKEKE